MTTLLLSPKFQIVIPKEIRKKLGLKPGQKLQITEKAGHIELSPIHTPDELVGILADCKDIPFEREPDRELP